jgi:hypothetical protein
MSTIQFKCDSCGIAYLGSTESNHVEGHWNRRKIKTGYLANWVKPYYICNNCIEADRKKYMEV